MPSYHPNHRGCMCSNPETVSIRKVNFVSLQVVLVLAATVAVTGASIARVHQSVTYDPNPLIARQQPRIAAVGEQAPSSPVITATLASSQRVRHAQRVDAGLWDRLAQCESSGDWGSNVGTFDGGLQFLPTTWRSFGGAQYAPYAHQATREQQIAIAERVLASQGWRAWPACSRKLGLR
jgi:Transglycosylase-like domain